MGFLDVIKKGAELAKKSTEYIDKQAKKKASRISDSKLLDILEKHPNNRYVREEANKRGL